MCRLLYDVVELDDDPSPFLKISFLSDVRAHTVWLASECFFSFSTLAFISLKEDFFEISLTWSSVTLTPRKSLISWTHFGRS